MLKFNYLSYLAFSVLFVFSACKDDDDELPGQPPTVNAGQDVTATVGSAVQLNGTASDPDGDNLTTNWSVTSAPQGSSATISNASSLTASFTPDVVGNYTIRLTADDGVYDPVTDELIITAEEAEGEPPVAVIRNEDNRPIDEENNEVTINTAYILDGSQTTDEDSEELTFSWEIIEGPEDHEAQLTPGEEGSTASFVPDLVGTYTIQLTVEDPEGNTDTETVELLATADPVPVSDNITTATSWPNIFDDPNLPDYHVTANITISAELTVAPGVKVMVEPNRRLAISGNTGALSAQGTADSLIVFTARDTLNGWDGIVFFNNSAQNRLEHTNISYGGRNDFGFGVEAANVGLEAAAGVTILNASIAHSNNYGLFAENGATLREFAENTFEENTNNPAVVPLNQLAQLDISSSFSSNDDNTVEIRSGTIDQNDELTIPALNNSIRYFVSGILNIDSGTKIEAGAKMEFAPGAYIRVRNEGYLTTEGTEADSVLLTARETVNGWGGIVFFNNNALNDIQYTQISYGGNTDFGFGVLASNIGVESAGQLKIANSYVGNSLSDYGIFLETTANLSGFENNTFANNNAYPLGLSIRNATALDEASTFTGNGNNYVRILGSSLNENSDLTLNAFSDGTSYLVSGPIDLDSHLDIAPATTLVFEKDTRIDVNAGGSLSANGTEDARITFTALNQEDGWQGIVFFSNFTSNSLKYVDIAYGGTAGFGFGVDASNIGVENQGKVALTNSNISDSKALGLFVEGNGQVVNAANEPLTNLEELEAEGNIFTDNASGPANF